MLTELSAALDGDVHPAQNLNCKGRVGIAQFGQRSCAIIAFDYMICNTEVLRAASDIAWVKMEYSDPLLDGTNWQHTVYYGRTSDAPEKPLGRFAVTCGEQDHLHFVRYLTADRKWMLLLQLTPEVVAAVEVFEDGTARFVCRIPLKLLP